MGVASTDDRGNFLVLEQILACLIGVYSYYGCGLYRVEEPLSSSN